MGLTGLKSDHLQNTWSNFKEGDFASLGILFETCYQELFYYGIKIVPLPELVKDAIQDLFTDLWERRNKMMDVENYKAYLLVSLRRKLIRKINKIREESSGDNFLAFQFSFSAEDFLIHDEENREYSKRMVSSLHKLTERQREVIMLRFYHGLEFTEISQVLDMNIQSVRNLLFRALEKIRKDMSDHGIPNLDSVELFLLFLFSKKI